MYRLIYWPGLPGRGEFVRLVLEQSGARYEDVADDVAPVLALKRTAAGFAPPYLVDGDTVIAQTSAICFYLGQKHGLCPHEPAPAARVLQMLESVADVAGEVHDTHHPISVELTYEEQTAEAKRRAAAFLDTRLVAWTGFFSTVLERDAWLANDTLSVADLCLMQLLDGIEYAFPRAFARTVTPPLAAHRERVRGLDGIRAYLASGRRRPFNQTGLFRHYPELDAS